MPDIGLTHIALPVSAMDVSIRFYSRYAKMEVIHRRPGSQGSGCVVWLCDGTRPFVLVLAEVSRVDHPLVPFAHLGVACATREELDQLCEQARSEGRLLRGPQDSGPPVGYWAFLRDPDGHTLELSYGQEVSRAISERGQRS
jgi:catechol 2,3-dioxygenase-like lactoylglutathione lyase family enzyme